jgi:hypothetical protein
MCLANVIRQDALHIALGEIMLSRAQGDPARQESFLTMPPIVRKNSGVH